MEIFLEYKRLFSYPPYPPYAAPSWNSRMYILLSAPRFDVCFLAQQKRKALLTVEGSKPICLITNEPGSLFAWRRGPNKLFDIVNSSLNILGPPPFEESKICLAFNRRLPNVCIVIADRFGPRAYPFARTWPSQTRLITTRLVRKVSTAELRRKYLFSCRLSYTTLYSIILYFCRLPYTRVDYLILPYTRVDYPYITLYSITLYSCRLSYTTYTRLSYTFVDYLILPYTRVDYITLYSITLYSCRLSYITLYSIIRLHYTLPYTRLDYLILPYTRLSYTFVDYLILLPYTRLPYTRVDYLILDYAILYSCHFCRSYTTL
ncbi:hypothetical protein CEXT_506521 [Caerostris extrusa]|uniref:Uncharacterized protein n=1 Tax=Caerostris extrusa TaxID=172846 RepID=A0AAV4QQA4_CAEEX|nr:hypothetical protein CEXT_506521 [Caerostris extrusa]